MLLVYMPYSSPRMSLGGWWGKRSSLGRSHSCQGISATFSPLQSHGCHFFFLGCVSQGCAYEPMPFGIWPLKYQDNGFCTWNLPIWHSLVLSVLHCSPWPSEHLSTVALCHPLHLCQYSRWNVCSASAEKEAEKDACAPVGFTHIRILDFCCTLSETCRICFFFLI